MSATRRKVRKLRHWKQRFDRDADFIWRKPVIWKGKQVVVGDPIPKDLRENRAKLKRFWESQAIELALFEEPDVATGREPSPQEPEKPPTVEDLVSKESDRKWNVDGLEESFTSRKAALEAASALVVHQALGSGQPDQPEGQGSEDGQGTDQEAEEGPGEQSDADQEASQGEQPQQPEASGNKDDDPLEF